MFTEYKGVQHRSLGFLSSEQKDNLKKLADHLAKTSKLNFHMGIYHGTPTEVFGGGNSDWTPSQLKTKNKTTPECGSVACAIGHGPYAGIKPLPYPDAETWNDYATRVFGAGAVRLHDGRWDYDNGEKLYAFLFSGAWTCIDNTAEGAAKRIYYALEHGIPMIGDKEEAKEFVDFEYSGANNG